MISQDFLGGGGDPGPLFRALRPISLDDQDGAFDDIGDRNYGSLDVEHDVSKRMAPLLPVSDAEFPDGLIPT